MMTKEFDQQRGLANVPERANIEHIALLEKRALHNRTLGDRLSASVTRVTGSVPFIVGHVIWFALWIMVNQGMFPAVQPFDPLPFSFLTLTVSLEAIFLASFVPMTQSRQSRDADRRAHLDLQVNLLAEQELTAILRMVHALAQKAKVTVDIEDNRVREMLKDTDVQAGAADVERHLDPVRTLWATRYRPCTIKRSEEFMKQHDAAKTRKSSTVEKRSQGKNPGDVADDRGLGITEDVGAGASSAGDQDIDTAGAEVDDRTMQQRSADAADEAGSAFLPHDKVFMQDEGLRRPAPKESLEGDADPETGKHTEATMPPGEGKDPKRNTM